MTKWTKAKGKWTSENNGFDLAIWEVESDYGCFMWSASNQEREIFHGHQTLTLEDAKQQAIDASTDPEPDEELA